MALHWVFGSSGAGKSTYLYNRMLTLSEGNPSGKYFIIVPEQFTMQTQKDMVMLSDNKGIMNIDVLSFMRLAYRVLKDTKELCKPVLSDEGKTMIIRRLLSEHASEWKSFGNNITKSGFTAEIKSLITEFIQYNLDENKLNALIDSASDRRILRDKLSDLKLLYKYYIEYMQENYISAEEILKLLSVHVLTSDVLKDSVVALSGYTGFTPIQYDLLEGLFAVCKDIYISVTIDAKGGFGYGISKEKYELFHMSGEYIRKVSEIAAKCGVEIKEPVICGKNNGEIPWRFEKNSELAFLEANLFRSRGGSFDKSNANNAIHIYEAANPYEECRYAAYLTGHLVRERNLKYKEIAIVTGDLKLYGRLMQNEFNKAEIPYFMDFTRNILSNSFVELITTFIEVCHKGFMSDIVIRLLRNGIMRDYYGFDKDRVDMLDNFVLACGIRYENQWLENWRYRGREAFDIDEINEIREKAVSFIFPYVERMRECETAPDYCKALFAFAYDNRMEDTIAAIADRYEKENNPYCMKEYEQIYGVFIGIIEQMAELMKDERLSAREFMELFTTGIRESAVGLIPMSIDTVIIGDIERTRLKGIKVLLFLGVNDTIIPKAGASYGFISDGERELLTERGASVAPTAREKIFNERFYLYLNATKPSESLYIMYSARDCGGAPLRPSSFVKTIKGMFGHIKTEKDYLSKGLDSKLGYDNGRRYWIGAVREAAAGRREFGAADKDFFVIHKDIMAKEEGRRLFEGIFYKGGEAFIRPQTALLLYGDEIQGSISRLEQFAKCEYAHFLKYGLMLRERTEYVVDIPDVGNIFHSIVERFARRINEKNIRWRDVSEEDIIDWTMQITENVCAEYGNGVLKSSGHNSYLKDRIESTAVSSMLALAEHMRKGSFEQMAYEVSFESLSKSPSLNYELGDGKLMHLTGIIDRIDTCAEDNRLYLKIIDYKSNERRFAADRLYYGLDMQLAVYMMAARENMEEAVREKIVVPAGVFYFHIDNPVYDEEENKNGAYKMHGQSNADMPVPYLLDNSLGDENGLYEGAKSEVVNIEVKKDKTISVKSECIPESYFDYMSQAAGEMIGRLGSGIAGGSCRILPYKDNRGTACDYCGFKSICGFDRRLGGYEYNRLKAFCDEDIWKEWREKYGKQT